MAVLYDSQEKLFTLQTKNTTYQMMEGPYGFLLHLYYGKKINDPCMDYLLTQRAVGMAVNPPDAGSDRTFSVEILPQEYTGCGVGDFRNLAVKVINADGSRTADFRYCSHEITKGAYRPAGMPALYDGDQPSDTLVITMEDRITGLELQLFYGVFENEDIITRAVTVTNRGTEPIRLEKLMSLHLDIPFGGWELVHFHGRHEMECILERIPLMHGMMSVGSRRGISSHQHNPGMILCRPETTEEQGECLGINLLYSGSFSAETEVDQMNQTRVMAGISPENFSFCLNPGDSFETPQAMMSYSREGFSRLSGNFHRIIRHNLCRGAYKLARRPVLINNWEATYFDFNEEKILKIAEKASELGIELMVLDDGWFGKRNDDTSGLGDWKVNEEKLPGGLKTLTDTLKRMGMKFGLWKEPEKISEDSDLYRSHEDWVLKVPGRKPGLGRGQLVLDMSRQEVRDYIFDMLADVLRSADIAYVKWDMNRSLSDVYSAELPPERQGEVCHRYVLGVYQLLERFVTEFPDILFEGCSSGGGRFDPGMLYYFPQIWCSDDTDAVERAQIQYGNSFFYPICTVGSHVSAVPNHQTGRTTPFETRGVVAMAGNLGYELDVNQLSEKEMEQVRQQVQRYHAWYDLIHDGEYYRISPPEDSRQIYAWEFVSEDKTRALISYVVTHVRTNQMAFFLRLRGLAPEKRYCFSLDGRDVVCSGEALMYGGIPIRNPLGDYPAGQIELWEV